MGVYDQSDWPVRFEWGEDGVRALAPVSDATVIVDVLSFSTSVDVATGRGAVVFPCAWRDAEVDAFAESVGAEVADHRNRSGFTLSPSTLEGLPHGRRIVLPSPNGSHLTMAAARHGAVLCGCLRNATAVARRAQELGRTVAVIACGERWPGSETLRPALEDLVGAGAILARLRGPRSPEAEGAVAAYERVSGSLEAALRACASGREKLAAGKPRDVVLAAALDVSAGAPRLVDGAFRA